MQDRNPNRVRKYSNPEGSVEAHREGDEHVVVSRGNEPRDRWEKRISAERTAVVEGEKRWTIPSNWEKKLTVKEDMINYGIYHIPETGVDVKVSESTNDHLVDCWYGVRQVGEFNVEYSSKNDKRLDQGALSRRPEEGVSKAAEGVLDTLANEDSYAWKKFVREYKKSVNMFAQEVYDSSIAGRRNEVPRMSGWTFKPGGDTWELQPIVKEACTIPREVTKEVASVLTSVSCCPLYPEFRVGVNTDGRLPEGYHITALIEAGCSTAEAVDYYQTEIVGRGQTEWAKVRNKDQSTISGNVSSAKRNLKA